jgi:hypothetical protein
VKNPDKVIPYKYMLKENFIHDYITNEFRNVSITHGKILPGGCSGRRPDWSIDCCHYLIVIECDEFQHINYEHEKKRMLEIFLDCDSKRVVFIRFNPDEYLGNSCFEFDDTNRIIPTEYWETRKEELKAEIQFHLDNEPKKDITVKYLCYDDGIEI